MSSSRQAGVKNWGSSQEFELKQKRWSVCYHGIQDAAAGPWRVRGWCPWAEVPGSHWSCLWGGRAMAGIKAVSWCFTSHLGLLKSSRYKCTGAGAMPFKAKMRRAHREYEVGRKTSKTRDREMKKEKNWGRVEKSWHTQKQRKHDRKTNRSDKENLPNGLEECLFFPFTCMCLLTTIVDQDQEYKVTKFTEEHVCFFVQSPLSQANKNPDQ